jgi:hypothetical protein
MGNVPQPGRMQPPHFLEEWKDEHYKWIITKMPRKMEDVYKTNLPAFSLRQPGKKLQKLYWRTRSVDEQE